MQKMDLKLCDTKSKNKVKRRKSGLNKFIYCPLVSASFASSHRKWQTLKLEKILTWKVSWPWPWIGSHGTHPAVDACGASWRRLGRRSTPPRLGIQKKEGAKFCTNGTNFLWMDGLMNGRMEIWTETSFIRLTQFRIKLITMTMMMMWWHGSMNWNRRSEQPISGNESKDSRPNQK